jgi:hypothetical protein
MPVPCPVASPAITAKIVGRNHFRVRWRIYESDVVPRLVARAGRADPTGVCTAELTWTVCANRQSHLSVNFQKLGTIRTKVGTGLGIIMCKCHGLRFLHFTSCWPSKCIICSTMIQRKVDRLVLWGTAVTLQTAVALLKWMRRSEVNRAPPPETQAEARAVYTA